MATAEDEANCAAWGQAVSSCTASFSSSSNTLPQLSSSSITLPPPSSSSSSVGIIPSSSSSANPACGSQTYNPSTQFCYNNSKVGNKCGTRTEAFDPDLYSCSGSVINLKNSVSYGGESYSAVLIGTQTWMAKNLNYTPSGGSSKCPDNVASNCADWGRQYDWATAMGIASSYNTTSYTATAKHKGICPTGWHIPSDTEWLTLINFVGSTPGAKLRLPTSVYAAGCPGTNNYGFSAYLVGYVEYGTLVDSYKEMDNIGFWWTTSQYNASNAYNRIISKSRCDVARYGVADNDGSMTKRNMLSVRCLKD